VEHGGSQAIVQVIVLPDRKRLRLEPMRHLRVGNHNDRIP
jgi:hypothetical protein